MIFIFYLLSATVWIIFELLTFAFYDTIRLSGIQIDMLAVLVGTIIGIGGFLAAFLKNRHCFWPKLSKLKSLTLMRKGIALMLLIIISPATYYLWRESGISSSVMGFLNYLGIMPYSWLNILFGVNTVALMLQFSGWYALYMVLFAEAPILSKRFKSQPSGI